VAVAEAGRAGEVRFFGEVDASSDSTHPPPRGSKLHHDSPGLHTPPSPPADRSVARLAGPTPCPPPRRHRGSESAGTEFVNGLLALRH
jgi:hypothetical protein